MNEPLTVSVTSNAPAYRDALINFMAKFGTGVRETIRYQGRLLGERVMAFTPPRNQKQGQDRVAKDIRKIILGLSPADFDQAHAVIGGEFGGFENVVRLFPARDGSILGVDKDLFRPNATAQDLNDFHQKKRLKSGRVSDAGQQTRDVGRWRFLEKMIAPQSVVDAYRLKEQGNVGRGKGGWAKGVIALGGGVAKWIAVHADQTGRFIDESNKADPSIEFINQSEWASGGDQDRIIDNAIKAKTRDINNMIRNKVREAGKSVFR